MLSRTSRSGGIFKSAGLTTAFALVALFALPAFASAATVSKNGANTVITYQANPAETNNVTVTWTNAADDFYTFTETGAGVTLNAGAGCVDQAGEVVTCSDQTPVNVTAVTVNLDDLGDVASASTVDKDPFTFTGGTGGDTITASRANGDVASGDDGVDTLNGVDGVDTLNGGNDTDTLNGGSQVDTENGGAGADMLFGNAQNDVMNGDDGNDQLIGGAGNDTMHGNAGNDVVSGDAGTDNLTGGADSDRLQGGDNDDVIDGGTGIDRWLPVTEAPASGACTEALGPILNLSIALQTNDCQNDQDTIALASPLVSTVESVTGTPLVDALTGSCGNDTLAGLAQNDALSADPNTCTANGSDFLAGFGGNDNLVGDGTAGTLGQDIVTYTQTTQGPCSAPPTGINVTTNDLADDTDCIGGTDNVHSNVDLIYGSNSNDTMNTVGTTSSTAPLGVQLFGRDGDDTLIGNQNDPLGDALNCEGGTGDTAVPGTNDTTSGSCEL